MSLTTPLPAPAPLPELPPLPRKTWREEHTWDLHIAGIHIDCKLAPLWAGAKRIGDGTPDKCPDAGKTARFHTHDYSGPLVCGCTEWGN